MRTLYKVSMVLALVAIPVIALAHPGEDGMDKDAMAARHAKRLATFDLDKNGVLDDAERAAMKEAMVDREFARLDVNKDGSISRAELAQGMRDFRGHGRRGHGGHGPRGGGDSKQDSK